jgi:phosphotransferase system  glucose/maltose/N-acetylglucosamine-specific IIC component
LHKKKYFTLLPPFLMLAIVLAFTLPSDKKIYALLAVFVFWITYYTWIYVEKKKQNE